MLLSKNIRYVLVFFILLLVLGIIALSTITKKKVAKNAQAAALPENICNQWNGLSNQVKGMTNNYNAMLSFSPSDIWAVGEYGGYSRGVSIDSLVQHWDGVSWKVLESPSFPYANELYAIDGVNPNNIWATGYKTSSVDGSNAGLIIHWDGIRWSEVSVPRTKNLSDFLYGIAAVNENDAWAVGWSSPTTYSPMEAYIVHWDGNNWSIAPHPNDSPNSLKLRSVTAISANDIWAVGYFEDRRVGAKNPLILHWDGSVWSKVTAPPIGDVGELIKVAKVSANDVWAVGNKGLTDQKALIMHWDGSQWKVVPSGDGGRLIDISVISANDILALSDSYTLHWDGASWTQNSTNSSPMSTIVAVDDKNVWSVGIYIPQGYRDYLPLTYKYGCNLPKCNKSFSDVPESNAFYSNIRCLSCRDIVNGYSDGTFRPNEPVTRAQMSKLVSQGANYTDSISSTTQTFSDVSPSDTFWVYIERAYAHGIITGYPCGQAPAGACDALRRPWFLPGNTVTRGQAAKFISIAGIFTEYIPTTTQTFRDVPVSSTFWVYIERAARHKIIGGYSDGTFRPGDNLTRGQAAKIISNTFYPNCQTL